MEPVTLDFIVRSVGGHCQHKAELPISGVSTDTRTIQPGSLFVALKGENFNGHHFIKAAEAAGAAAVLCEEVDAQVKIPQIAVEKTGEAFLALAGAYRRLFSIPVCGVTGSVGKTTAKEMIHAAFSKNKRTLKNEGNLNNEIGVPHTLFRLDKSFESAVVEMGMSGPGEISALTRAVNPTVAVITNIGVSHIEKLGSRENILKAKLEIAEGLPGNGVLLLSADCEMLAGIREKTRHKQIFFGIKSDWADVRAINIETKGSGSSFDISYKGEFWSASVDVPGMHHILSALAAFAASAALGFDLDKCISGFHDFSPAEMRQNIYKKNGITVIMDCYNASPDSMRAALSLLKSTEGKRKVAVLGDMLELGQISAECHRELGKRSAEDCDAVFCFGNETRLTAEESEMCGIKTFWNDNKELLSAELRKFLAPGDVVLFKGSRGMKLEEIAERMTL